MSNPKGLKKVANIRQTEDNLIFVF